MEERAAMGASPRESRHRGATASQPALRITLTVLACIPILSGASAILLGTASLPEPSVVSATVDSEYRFVNVLWLSAGLLLLWTTLRMRERRTITRVVLAVAALGGFARIISVIAVGWPHPVFVATIVLELVVVPLVLWWHARAVPKAPITA